MIRCPCGPEGFDIGVRRYATRKCGGTFIDGAQWNKPDDDECSLFTLSARKLCELASVSSCIIIIKLLHVCVYCLQLEESEEQLDGLNDISSDAENFASLEVSISTVFVEDLDMDVIGNQSVSIL